MKLRILRLLEMVFAAAADYCGDWADSIDTKLHEQLRAALRDTK